jgi:hypothetical protein
MVNGKRQAVKGKPLKSLKSLKSFKSLTRLEYLELKTSHASPRYRVFVSPHRAWLTSNVCTLSSVFCPLQSASCQLILKSAIRNLLYAASISLII